MKAIAEVTADHHHADIHTQAHAGTERYVAPEIFASQQTSRSQRVILDQPYISGIKEKRAMKNADQREPVFRIELEFECTCLVEIAVLIHLGRMVAARAERAHGEGTY